MGVVNWWIINSLELVHQSIVPWSFFYGHSETVALNYHLKKTSNPLLIRNLMKKLQIVCAYTKIGATQHQNSCSYHFRLWMSTGIYLWCEIHHIHGMYVKGFSRGEYQAKAGCFFATYDNEGLNSFVLLAYVFKWILQFLCLSDGYYLSGVIKNVGENRIPFTIMLSIVVWNKWTRKLHYGFKSRSEIRSPGIAIHVTLY